MLFLHNNERGKNPEPPQHWNLLFRVYKLAKTLHNVQCSLSNSCGVAKNILVRV
jgi:hypothetical protein